MKIEDAIQYLRDPVGKSLLKHENAVNMAVKALKKQMPQTPMFIEGSSYAWRCPACGAIAKNTFCEECGQKFNWELAK